MKLNIKHAEKIIFPAILFLLILGINGKVKKDNRCSKPVFFKKGRLERAMERNSWYAERLKAPGINKIPRKIRNKELAFARNIQAKYSERSSSEPTFENRGPFNVGGRTRALAIDVTNDSIYLAGGTSGAIYRSIDQGDSWVKQTEPDQVLSISCIVQDVRTGRESTWYFGTGEAFGASASGGGAYYLGNGIYKSTDSGKTWSSLEATATNTPHDFDGLWDLCWNMAVDNSNDSLDIIYTAILGAIMRSDDGGLSWTKSLGGSTSAFSYCTDVITTDSGVVYATLSSDGPASQNGLWRSQDGINWVNITDTLWPAIYDRVVIGVNPHNQKQVYFLAVTPGAGKECISWDGDSEWISLWKYEEYNGGIWTDLSANIPTGPYRFDDFSPQGGYNLHVTCSPYDSNTVFIGGTNLYRSTDGFTSDSNTTFIGGYKEDTDLPFFDLYPNQHPDQHRLVFQKNNPNIMIAATDGGLFKSDDSQAPNITWESLNKGYLTTQFYTIAINEKNNSEKILGGLQDNGTHFIEENNPEGDWVMSFTYDGAYCAIPDHENYVFMSAQSGKIIKATLDSAGQISSWARIDPSGGHDYSFVAPFILDPNNNERMYLAAGRQLWRNDDLSGISLNNNFDSISTNWFVFTDSILGTPKISALAVSKTPPNILYLGASQKRVYRIEDAHTGDPSWEEITGFLPTIFPSQGNVSCIAIDPYDADELFVVFSNYRTYSIYQTKDAGQSWIKVAGNLEANTAGTLEGPSCRWLEILPLADRKAYVLGSSTGLYYTLELDSMNTEWMPLANETIGNNVVEMIKYRESDGLLVVATHGNGVFSSHIQNSWDLTGLKDNNEIKESLSIFPNPSHGEINLVFSFTPQDIMELKVYNVSGCEVDFNLIKEQSKYTVVPKRKYSGIHYIKVYTLKGVVTKKVLLLDN